MASKLAREKAAQAWCTPETEGIVMDPPLAEAFADILDEVWGKPRPTPEKTGMPCDDEEREIAHHGLTGE